MATKLWAIGLVIFCTFLTAIAQIFYKIGADRLVFNFYSVITNFHLLSGLFLYLIAAIILIVSLKYGELSVLYPIIATGYIWVSFLSIYFLDEVINLYKWTGIIIIFIGVSLIGYGGNH
jgi:undecaprenyl phosphate-alpha-L-ara4N flippase subunit ArnE